MAALRSAVSIVAACSAYASSRGPEVARGIDGRTNPASSAMIARTHTISISVKPASSRFMARLLRGALDLGGGARSAGLPGRAIGRDFIGCMIRRRSVDVGAPPGIGGHRGGLDVRTVPGCGVAGSLHEGRQPLRG